MPGPDDERIEIDVVLNDMTSPAAENVDRKLKDIDDSGKSTDGTLEDLGTTVDENGKKWRRFGGILRRSKKDVDEVGKSSEETRKKVKGLGDESTRTARKVSRSSKSMKRSFGGLFKFMGKLRGMLMFGIKWGVIADGIGFLGTAIKGLGAAGYAAVAGLSPLVGLMGAMPGMLATLLQGMGVVKLATAGVGKAIEVMANPKATVEEYKEATKDLHAEQIRFAQSVATSIPIWKELRKEVGGRFFKNVGPWYLQLTKRYQPLLNKQLGRTAELWNDIIIDSAKYLDSKKGYEAFGDVLEGNNKVMENGSGILTGGLRGSLVFLRAASPMLQTMASDFSRWTNQGADWLETNESRVTKFLNRSWELAKDVGSVIGDFAVGLYNIGKYSEVLGDMMGKKTTDIASDFRAWTESKKGRREIKQFFSDMRPIVREVGRWVRDLSIGMNDVTMDNNDFMKLSKTLRKDGIPAIVDLVKAFQGYGLPMLAEGASIYSDLKEAGVTGGVGRAFNVFLDGLGKVASMAADMPDSAKNLVAFATGLGAAYGILQKIPGGKTLTNAIRGRGGMADVQKVWVMNPGFGGGRGPGTGFVGSPGSRRAPGRARTGGIRGILSPGQGTRRGTPGWRKPGFRGLGLGSVALGLGGSVLAGSDRKGSQLVGNAMQGASLGYMFGPVGAGIGAAGGTLLSMRSMAKQTAAERANNYKNPAWLLDSYSKELATQQKWKSQMWMGQNPMTGAPEMKFPTNASGQMLYSEDQLKASQAQLRKFADTFEELTGQNLTEFNNALRGLPKEVRTDILTPGLEWSNKMQKELLTRFDMTPKQKQTVLRLIGAEESQTKVRDLKAMIDALQDKVVRINVERTQTLIATGSGGIGKGEDAFGGPRFRGGNTMFGKMYLAGEAGPEAWVGRNGGIRMLGINGPELVKPGTGAVVNHTRTANPFAGDGADSPTWAVAALQRAVGSSARKGAESAGGTTTAVPVHVSIGPVYASDDVDVERAVKKALKDIEDDRNERG